jgi:hypothetical protein
MTDIQTGDVCLDLAQGRPVHIIEPTGQTVAEWSDANGYDLADNYGNARLDTTADDMVFDVVYCSSAKSDPSKSYAMPSSRLLRVETEHADGGRPVRERVVRDVLERLFILARETNPHPPIFDNEPASKSAEEMINTFASMAFDAEIADEARELADVEQTIGGEQ